MRAMILAAGLGKRLRPLTEHLPKALVEVGGKPLIEHHIEKLAAAGIRELVINLSWLGEQIERRLGDGARFGVAIQWSREPEPLETGGGIRRALPWLGERPFAVISADVWSDYPYQALPPDLPDPVSAHLVLVANPGHHPAGDYRLESDARVRPAVAGAPSLTFGGIAVIAPELVAGFPEATAFPLRDALAAAIAGRRVTGALHTGRWSDVGTPERLAALRAALEG
ncbi:MAG: N-acetylmuramate alpha-1-phosphate uridylyltransferase MurU [Pseudomonadota bacterium]|jgi:N-acetyl-alpha-D-muramate 1-phosphate uridylyltransferase